MITSLTWIPKGAARTRPVRFELSAAELTRVKALAKNEEAALEEDKKDDDAEESEGEEEDAAMDADEENADDVDDSELPAELRMNEYDDDEDEDMNGMEDFDGEDDIAVMEQGNVAYADEEEWDAEDLEDNEIKPNDALLVVAMTEDEFSHLEVQLFSDEGNLFVHHDITLPDFPLSLAWMDCPPFQTADGSQSSVGNYIAVGTFSPAIEIWNLDVLDPLEPTAVLGGENPEFATAGKKKKVKGKKMSAFLPGSHEAAVMGLSWNTTYRQALASGSADTTVKIWDVTTQVCSHTFTHHTDKVQSVSWHPTEAWLLATGSFDKTIGLIDARSATTTSACSLPADIESLSWDPFNAFNLYCALEDGTIVCVDVRNCASSGAGKAKKDAIRFSFQAHEQTTSGISFSQRVPGMLATASIDKTVKIWDVNDLQASNGGAPRCVAYKTMNVGKLFALQYSPDDPYLLACAGDTGMVAVWESDELSTIEDYFKSRVQPSKLTYTALKSASEEASGAAGAAAATTSTEAFVSTGQLSGVESAMAEKADDSWMQDEAGVAGAGGAGEETKKKKKKFMKDKKHKN